MQHRVTLVDLPDGDGRESQETFTFGVDDGHYLRFHVENGHAGFVRIRQTLPNGHVRTVSPLPLHEGDHLLVEGGAYEVRADDGAGLVPMRM